MSKNRWEKLSQKYANDPGITSEEVKKFLEMNFTDGYHDELCGKSKKKIDPALIMNLRHESVKKPKPKSSTNKFKVQKELNMESIKNHNNLVDSRMIDNELSKFKMDIRKLSIASNSTPQKYRDSLESDNEDNGEEVKLLKALRESENATFAYRNNSNKIIVETTTNERAKISKFDHFEFSYEEGSAFSGSTTTISEDSLELNFIKVSTQPRVIEEVKEFQEYYEIEEDNSKFNVDDDENGRNEQQKLYDPICYMCCTDGECEFSTKDYDSHSFYSLPNLSDNDVESLMKISKFQSLMSIDTPLKDCPCCPCDDNEIDDKMKQIDKSIEEAETERMLIVRRMEIEEKNLQELVIMSSTHSKNINDAFEYEKIINDLFLSNGEPPQNAIDREILRKAFKDWLQKTTVSKILKTNAFTNEDRVKKINEFLNKIRLEQNKGLAKRKTNKREGVGKSYAQKKTATNSSKTLRKDYENKLKSQQDTIELQKLKIQRQERLITEMKLAKFTEMVKESKNDLKMELINAKRGNTKLRAKARCIEMIANIPPDPIEEERRKLLAQGLMMPKFLAKMQERAAERLARHEEARERRVRLEHEKEEAKNAAEIAKRLEDEEAKRKRYFEMREKRRQEKFAKQLKEQERRQYQEDLKKARDHYNRNLLKRIGFHAFELLIRLKRINFKKSTIHRRRICMKKCFKLWHANAKVVWDHKRAQANKCYGISVLRMCIRRWRHIHSINQSKFLVAIDWYEVKFSEKLFKCWTEFTLESRYIENAKLRNADAHYQCQIKWKLFECWHRFPAVMRIERETEIRRQKWRMKIWDLLPDYKPQQDTP